MASQGGGGESLKDNRLASLSQSEYACQQI